MRIGVLYVVLFCLLTSCANKSVMQSGQANLVSIPIDSVDALMKKEPRPILLFLHTDWCKFCAHMQHTTLRDATVVDYLNASFYYVPFDGEEQSTVELFGNTYRFRPTGAGSGVHELAEHLGTIDGQLAYPVIVLLNSNREIVFQHSGYLSGDELIRVLKAAVGPHVR